MAIAPVVQGVVAAAGRYGPTVVSKAGDLLKQVTSGRVTNINDLKKYVGNSPARLQVTTEAMVRAGMRVDDLLPADLTSKNAQLAEMRQRALALVNNLQEKARAGEDQTLGENDAAADVLRARRVKAALSVYGSETNYFLCNPNGGIPASDFAWYQAMRKAM